MYPKGSRNGEELGLSGLQNAFGILADDAGNLVIADSFGAAVDVFPPKSMKPSRSIGVQGPAFIAFDKSEKQLYVAAGTDDVIYDYATGGQRVALRRRWAEGHWAASDARGPRSEVGACRAHRNSGDD
jgi:DNA-binding beta-propeller fold protein YncE